MNQTASQLRSQNHPPVHKGTDGSRWCGCRLPGDSLLACNQPMCYDSPFFCTSGSCPSSVVHIDHQTIPMQTLLQEASQPSSVESSQSYRMWMNMDHLVHQAAQRAQLTEWTGESLVACIENVGTSQQCLIVSNDVQQSVAAESTAAACEYIRDKWLLCCQTTPFILMMLRQLKLSLLEQTLMAYKSIKKMDPNTQHIIIIGSRATNVNDILEMLIAHPSATQRIRRLSIHTESVNKSMLGQIQQSFPQLEHLSLMVSTCEQEHIAAISQLRICQIQLEIQQLDSRDARDLDIKRLVNITQLTLNSRDRWYLRDFEMLVEKLKCLPCRISLSIYVYMYEEEIGRVAANLKNIRTLESYAIDVRYEAEEVDKMIGRLVQAGGLSHVQAMEMTGCQASVDAIRVIAGLQIAQFKMSYTQTSCQDVVSAISQMSSLTQLELNAREGQYDGIAPNIGGVGELKNLQNLRLDNNIINSQGARWIGKLRQLRKLSLRNNPIADAGMEQLAALTNLTVLQLENNGLEEGGRYLSKLTQLADLFYQSNNLTREGAAGLENLRRLRFMRLSLPQSVSANVEVGVSLARALLSCSLLRVATINRVLSDEAIMLLCRHSTLKDLAISNNFIGDQSTFLLSRMSQLKTLEVEDCYTTWVGQTVFLRQTAYVSCDLIMSQLAYGERSAKSAQVVQWTGYID